MGRPFKLSAASVSIRGVEACSEKSGKILEWLCLSSAVSLKPAISDMALEVNGMGKRIIVRHASTALAGIQHREGSATAVRSGFLSVSPVQHS